MNPILYARCPKCDHAPLPHDQAFPAACPGCGLILARYASRPTLEELKAARAQGDDDNGAEPGWLTRILFGNRLGDSQIPSGPHSASSRSALALRLVALTRFVPEKVDPITFWGRVALLALFAIWGVRLIAMDFRTGEIGSSFLHGPLLVFHEAGHVLFMLFGHFLMIAGGTLGQLIMPAVISGALLLKRDPFGAAIGLWLFGVSLLDVAPYVYDAKAPQLVLLGGHTGEEGGHDWIEMLSTLGLLERSQSLGWLVHKLGAIVVLGALTWAAWLLWQQKRRLHSTLEESP